MFVKITVDPRGQKRVIKLKVLLLVGKTKTESWTELIDHPLYMNAKIIKFTKCQKFKTQYGRLMHFYKKNT